MTSGSGSNVVVVVAAGAVLVVAAGAVLVVAAGAVVPERMEIPPGVLAAGVPASVKKALSGSAQHWVQFAAEDYQQRRRLYLESSAVADAG